MNPINAWLGRALGRYLTAHNPANRIGQPSAPELLARALIPGDVLLVEGDLRISQMIKYLTQSTWSHAAIYVGDKVDLGCNAAGEPLVFIEADLLDGVRACPLSEYSRYHTRICRAKGLTEADQDKLFAHLVSQLGRQYDLKHVYDLARYLLPLPIPARFRRRMITLGSGDPTKAICSSLVAEAFATIRYPIVPTFHPPPAKPILMPLKRFGRFQRKHPHWVVPRDFDVSPYFEIIKPSLGAAFDYRQMPWYGHDSAESPSQPHI